MRLARRISVQHQRAREMPAGRDGRDAGEDLCWFLWGEESADVPDILSLAPLFVQPGEINRTTELIPPGQVGGVVVRVADHNRFQSALGFNPVYGLAVEQGQAVPEDVSVGGGFDQDCALADGEFRGGG